MQRQQSCKNVHMHAVTDLAHVGRRSDGEKKERQKEQV